MRQALIFLVGFLVVVVLNTTSCRADETDEHELTADHIKKANEWANSVFADEDLREKEGDKFALDSISLTLGAKFGLQFSVTLEWKVKGKSVSSESSQQETNGDEKSPPRFWRPWDPETLKRRLTDRATPRIKELHKKFNAAAKDTDKERIELKLDKISVTIGAAVLVQVSVKATWKRK